MSGGLVFSLCVIFGCLGYLLGYWVRDVEAIRDARRKNVARRLRPANVVSLTRYRFEKRGATL